MLSSVKRIISETLTKHDVPILSEAFLKRQSRRTLAHLAKRSTLTYDEIEKIISDAFKKNFGRELNWDNPKTFNEKINVSKLYDRDPRKTQLADKVLVRDWIKNTIGEKYSIPLIGVYNNADEIDFEKLPEKCVLKCNHDSGSVIIWDKSKHKNINLIKLKLNNHLKINYAWTQFEMNYKDIKPKITVEEFINSAFLNDYRFFCFGGVPAFCAVDFYTKEHKRSHRNFYDMNWDLQPFRLHYPNYNSNFERPVNFDEMKELATKLSQNFGHVRVDFYQTENKLYFGEMTFYHASGGAEFIPDEYDYKIGELWNFDNSLRAKERAKSIKP